LLQKELFEIYFSRAFSLHA